MRIEVKPINKGVTFEGDQWDPVHDDAGRLVAYRAQGTNCTVKIDHTAYTVRPEDTVNFLPDRMAALPPNTERNYNLINLEEDVPHWEEER
jgi:hypothetical protein